MSENGQIIKNAQVIDVKYRLVIDPSVDHGLRVRYLDRLFGYRAGNLRRKVIIRRYGLTDESLICLVPYRLTGSM